MVIKFTDGLFANKILPKSYISQHTNLKEATLDIST